MASFPVECELGLSKNSYIINVSLIVHIKVSIKNDIWFFCGNYSNQRWDMRLPLAYSAEPARFSMCVSSDFVLGRPLPIAHR